jgi:hypothetical protein
MIRVLYHCAFISSHESQYFVAIVSIWVRVAGFEHTISGLWVERSITVLQLKDNNHKWWDFNPKSLG